MHAIRNIAGTETDRLERFVSAGDGAPRPMVGVALGLGAAVFPGRLFYRGGTVPPGSWYGTLLKGVFTFRPDRPPGHGVAAVPGPDARPVFRPGRVRLREGEGEGT